MSANRQTHTGLYKIDKNHKNKVLNIIFQVSVTLRELGLDHTDGYHIMDLYDNYDYGIVTPERRFKVDVNPSGSKQIWKLQSCKL